MKKFIVLLIMIAVLFSACSLLQNLFEPADLAGAVKGQASIVLSITSPSDGSVLPTAFTVTGKTSGNDLEGVYLAVNGGSYDKANGTAEWTKSMVLAGNADGLNYTLTVYAKDSKGNYSATNSIKVAVCDGSAPACAYYVATNGNDANGGGKLFPLKTIQLAVDRAAAKGITNVYVGAGEYTPGNGLSNVNNCGVFITNNNIKLSGNKSLLNGQNTINHIILLQTATNISIDNFIIENGNNCIQDLSGAGGIYINQSHYCLITNTTIQNNSAYHYGGGISIFGNSNTISATISNNSLKFYSDNIGDYYYGGGLYLSGKNNIIYGLINNNKSDQLGGGIFIYGNNNQIYADVISNSSIGSGGGIFINSASNSCFGLISDNVSSSMGSGIFISNNNNNIYSSTLRNSATLNGGGICIFGNNNLVTSQVLDNISLDNGSGLYISGFNNKVSNSLISGNKVNNDGKYGGGIYVTNASNITIINNVLTNNCSGVSDVDHNSVIGLYNNGNLKSLVISNNLIGGGIVYKAGDPSYSVGIYEINSDVTNQLFVNNKFMTNMLKYLYYDFIKGFISNNEIYKLNTTSPTNYTGAAAASGNIAQ